MTPIVAFDPGLEPIHLPVYGSCGSQWHVFDEPAIWAIRSALATGRPLLLRGEPGTGKSQLARAAAFVMNRPWLSAIITSQSTSQDLLWNFDAVARLGSAQILGALGAGNVDGVKNQLDEKRFVTPGPLWWAFNWNSALSQLQKSHQQEQQAPFYDPENSTPDNGVVLLIDEIDKADVDLPNGLLDALGNGGFEPPHGLPAVRQHSGGEPLVVITTNEERELPAAFLRRCLVFNLELPTQPEALASWLIRRGKIHFRHVDETVLTKAADLLIEDRQSAHARGIPKPGQAEYLDLLRAITSMASRYHREPHELIEEVRAFTFQKHTPEEER